LATTPSRALGLGLKAFGIDWEDQERLKNTIGKAIKNEPAFVETMAGKTRVEDRFCILILLQLACFQQFLSRDNSTPLALSGVKNLYEGRGMAVERVWGWLQFL
jgi:hypothetical protein